MKSIKQLFKMLVLFLIVFLFHSCSSEDVNNQQRESTEIHIPGKKESNERYLIASIIEDEVIWDFSLNELENHILENEILQIIESINIDYGLNPEENKKEAF